MSPERDPLHPEHSEMIALTEQFQELMAPLLANPELTWIIEEDDDPNWNVHMVDLTKDVFIGVNPPTSSMPYGYISIHLANASVEQFVYRQDEKFFDYDLVLDAEGVVAHVQLHDAINPNLFDLEEEGIAVTDIDRFTLVNQALEIIATSDQKTVDGTLQEWALNKVETYDPNYYDKIERDKNMLAAISSKDAQTTQSKCTVESTRYDNSNTKSLNTDRIDNLDSEIVSLHGNLPSNTVMFVNEALLQTTHRGALNDDSTWNYLEAPFFVYQGGDRSVQRFGLVFNESLIGIIGQYSFNELPPIIDIELGEQYREDFIKTSGRPNLDKNAAYALYKDVAGAGSHQELKDIIDEWVRTYSVNEVKGRKETPITSQEAFDIISNEREIVGSIEEELLTANFKEITESNDYVYKLPRHHGKEVVVHSSNYFENDETWNTDFSNASITIEVNDHAHGTQKTVTLLNAGSKEYRSSDSSLEMGDTICTAIETILEQDKKLPALGENIRQDLVELNEALFHNLATGKISPTFIAQGIAALRYSLGRSDTQPQRTRMRSIRRNEGTATIVETAIMTKAGNGSSLPLSRKTIFTKPNRMLRTLDTSVLISDPNLNKTQTLRATAPHGTLSGVALQVETNFEDAASEAGVPLQKIPLMDSAQLIKNLGVFLKQQPKYQASGPISTYVRKG